MALMEENVRPVASPSRGFRPSNRGRSRIAAGVALAAVAVGGNVLVYSSLDDRIAVLQVARDVPAGAELTRADLRTVEVDADESVHMVDADAIAGTVGRFAKVRIAAGSLLVTETLQDTPLVSEDSAIVAIQVGEGGLPIGLREQSRVQLVVATADGGLDAVHGTVVGLPVESGTVSGTLSVSVEVPASDAPRLAIADDVRVVLLPPDLGGVAT